MGSREVEEQIQVAQEKLGEVAEASRKQEYANGFVNAGLSVVTFAGVLGINTIAETTAQGRDISTKLLIAAVVLKANFLWLDSIWALSFLGRHS